MEFFELIHNIQSVLLNAYFFLKKDHEYINTFRYRVTRKERDFRDDCIEFVPTFFLQSLIN